MNIKVRILKMPTTITVRDRVKYVDHTGLTYKEFVLLAADLSRAVYKPPHERPNISGYLEQASHTGGNSGVWINPETNHGFVVYKGTNTIEEWLVTNPHIACTTMAYSSAFHEAVDYYDDVTAAYDGIHFDVAGHSLGGTKALFVATMRDTPFAMTYNAGIGSRMINSLLAPGKRLFPDKRKYLIVRNSRDFASMNRHEEANEYTYTNTPSGVFSIGFNPLSQHSINQFTTAALEDGSWELPEVDIRSIVRRAANLPPRILKKLAELVRLHRNVYDQIEEPYVRTFDNLFEFEISPHQLHNSLVRDIMQLRERVTITPDTVHIPPLQNQKFNAAMNAFVHAVEADMGAHEYAQEQAADKIARTFRTKPPSHQSMDGDEDAIIQPSKKPRIGGRQRADRQKKQQLVDGNELTDFQKSTEYTQQDNGMWKKNPTSGGRVQPVGEGEVFRGGESVFWPGDVDRPTANPKIDAHGYDHTPVISSSSTSSSSTSISTSPTTGNGLNIQLPHDISLSMASSIRTQVTAELEAKGPLNLITQEEIDQLVEIVTARVTGVTKKLPADIPDVIEVVPKVPTVVPEPAVPPTWKPFSRFDVPPEVPPEIPPGVPPEAGPVGEFVDVPLSEPPVIGAGAGIGEEILAGGGGRVAGVAAEGTAIASAEVAASMMFLPLDVLNIMSLGQSIDNLWNTYKSDRTLKKTGWYKHLNSASDGEGFFESIGFWDVSDSTRADRIFNDYSGTLEYNENIFESQDDYHLYTQLLLQAKTMGSGDPAWINFAQVAKAYEREQQKDNERLKNFKGKEENWHRYITSQNFVGSSVSTMNVGQTLAYQYALLNKYHGGKGRDWVTPSSERAIMSAVAMNAEIKKNTKHDYYYYQVNDHPTYDSSYDTWLKAYEPAGKISDLGPDFDLTKIWGVGHRPPGMSGQTISVPTDNNMDDFHETRFYTKYPGTDNLINLSTLSYDDVSKLSVNDIYIPTPHGDYQAVGMRGWANADLSTYVSGRKNETPGSHHDVEGGTRRPVIIPPFSSDGVNPDIAHGGGLKPANGVHGTDDDHPDVIPPHQQDPIIGQPSNEHPEVIPHGGGTTPDIMYPGWVHDGWLGPDTNVHTHDTNNHIGNNPESMSEPAYDSAIKRFMNGAVTSRSVMASRGMNFTRFAEIADLNSTLATNAADMLAT